MDLGCLYNPGEPEHDYEVFHEEYYVLRIHGSEHLLARKEFLALMKMMEAAAEKRRNSIGSGYRFLRRKDAPKIDLVAALGLDKPKSDFKRRF